MLYLCPSQNEYYFFRFATTNDSPCQYVKSVKYREEFC